jgi:hypothetical protein
MSRTRAYFETRLGEWWAVTKDNGFPVEIDTGVPVTFTSFYQLLEIRTSSSTAVEFFINGVLRASTLNHPQVGLNSCSRRVATPGWWSIMRRSVSTGCSGGFSRTLMV